MDWRSIENHLWVLFGFLLFTLAFYFADRLLLGLMKKHAHKLKKNQILYYVYLKAKLMVRLLIFITYLGVTAHVLNVYFGVYKLDNGHWIKPYNTLLTQTFEAIVLAWIMFFVVRIVKAFELYTLFRAKTGITVGVDSDIVKVTSKVTQVIILVFLGIGVLGIYGQDISSLLAVGGVGTIAIGFAAQNTLSNFFGGFFVLTDRPFAEGDWIRSPDRKIEGTVEEIGWRMTKIRTFDKTLLFIPNSVFSTIVLENVSGMTHRRIKLVIGVRYRDASALPNLIDSIRKYAQRCKDIDKDMYNCVDFNSFGDSSLNVKFIGYVPITSGVAFNAVKDKVYFKIMHIVKEHGCDFPFPTQTVYLPDMPSKETDSK